MIDPGMSYEKPLPAISRAVERIKNHENYPRIGDNMMARIIEEEIPLTNLVLWAGAAEKAHPGWRFWKWWGWMKLALEILVAIRIQIEDDL